MYKGRKVRCIIYQALDRANCVETEADPSQVFACLQALIQEDLLYELSIYIHKLPFEARKDTQYIFSSAFRYRHPGSTSQDPDVLYYVVKERPQIITSLCNGYAYRESASPCGGMLREALKSESVAAVILYDGQDQNDRTLNLSTEVVKEIPQRNGAFWRFFDWIEDGAFEISADAFSTFRDLLMKHKELVSEFLEANFDDFFVTYHKRLISSDNYVTKRQSIKLLGELLLERSYYRVMTRYVASPDHLKIVMQLLREKPSMIKFETFHVFKIFVANPDKSYGVQKILINNREKLLAFLPSFCEEKNDDVQFSDEKAFLIKHLQGMPKEPTLPPPDI